MPNTPEQQAAQAEANRLYAVWYQRYMSYGNADTQRAHEREAMNAAFREYEAAQQKADALLGDA